MWLVHPGAGLDVESVFIENLLSSNHRHEVAKNQTQALIIWSAGWQCIFVHLFEVCFHLNWGYWLEESGIL